MQQDFTELLPVHVAIQCHTRHSVPRVRITPQHTRITCVTWHTPHSTHSCQQRVPACRNVYSRTRHTPRVKRRSFCFPPTGVQCTLCTIHLCGVLWMGMPAERACTEHLNVHAVHDRTAGGVRAGRQHCAGCKGADQERHSRQGHPAAGLRREEPLLPHGLQVGPRSLLPTEDVRNQGAEGYCTAACPFQACLHTCACVPGVGHQVGQTPQNSDKSWPSKSSAQVTQFA